MTPESITGHVCERARESIVPWNPVSTTRVPCATGGKKKTKEQKKPNKKKTKKTRHYRFTIILLFKSGCCFSFFLFFN
jgi:hypothetical protein